MRSFLLSNRLSLLLFFALCIAWSARVSLAADVVRPNVVLIYTDDQGSIDTNVYGADDLITPHTDALARRGVRFTQMYAPAPICSASRAGLITGCFPARAGVPGNVSPTDRKTDMPNEQVTIAEMMRDAGYATGHVGKWHLGHGPTTTPLGQGFDQSFGHMGGCIDNYSHFFYWNGPNRHDLWRDGKEIWADGQFFPDLMVEECQKFIAANQERPFFLYWAINVPHYPLQGTDKWREKYQHLEFPRDMYAAFVSTMDECVGKVLTQLDELGLTDNTLVIFQSDHGHSTEERTFGGGGNAGPYRGAKQCLFEGGAARPFDCCVTRNHPRERSPRSDGGGLRLVAHHRRDLQRSAPATEARRARHLARHPVGHGHLAPQLMALAVQYIVGRASRRLEADRQPAGHQQQGTTRER